MIYNLEKRRTHNLDETFGVQKSVFEIHLFIKEAFLKQIRKSSLHSY